MSREIIWRDVSRETWNDVHQLWLANETRLNAYAETLFALNQRINLISRKLSLDDVRDHIFHSLIPICLFKFSHHTILDTGTGGGLPGIPLAIIQPENHFILHDKSTKKESALKEIISTLHLTNCTTRSDDLNNLTIQEPISLVSKHAFKLDDFFRRSRKVNWKEAVFYKGRDFEKEINASHLNKYFFYAWPLDELGEFFSEKVILKIEHR